MEKTFITITHLDDFMALNHANPGVKLVLRKEPNEYDDESITVYSEKGTKYGYVANSCRSVARGTHSAGYIYRDFNHETSCVIRFRYEDIAIAELLNNSESVYSEYLKKGRNQHFVKTSSAEERKALLEYLKDNGFSVDNEQNILESPFPIIVEMNNKKISVSGGAAMAACAASSDMIFTTENFYKMFNELLDAAS